MYQILIAPLAAMIIAQLAKPLVKSNNLKFSWLSFFSYSGMPSGHTAMAVSLASSVGLVQGLSSPLFAASVVLCFFIIRDALSLRQYVGRNGQVLNNLIADLKKNISLNEDYPTLTEKVGHTPSQIIGGAVIGYLISLAAYYIF